MKVETLVALTTRVCRVCRCRTVVETVRGGVVTGYRCFTCKPATGVRS